MKYSKKWELINEDTTLNTTEKSYRLKVPGGWIVRSVVFGNVEKAASVHQVFIKDIKHTWSLE